MNTLDRLTRARIQIQKTNPFFAYLSLFLTFKEGKDLPDYAGAGVNARGDFFYKEKFFDELTDKQVIGVVIHEILHLSFLHLLRLGERHMKVWNVACDIAVNQLIKDNGYSLPDSVIVSDDDNTIIIDDKIKIVDCDKKSAEELYDELKPHIKEIEGNENDGGKYYRFDEHIEGQGGAKGKEKLTPEERKELEESWKDKVEEAYVSAKMRGDLPVGIERLVGKLHESKIDWKSLLYRYITSYIPYDYAYTRPHKKSVSAGFYMPDITKERVNVTIGIDTSGSIGKEELRDFISEIVGMARAFKHKIAFRLLTHDIEVHDDYKIENGNVEKIKKIEVHGGGGTSHKPIFEYIRDNDKSCEVAIFLTDGYSDLEDINFEEFRFAKIIMISEKGRELEVNAKVIQL